MGGLPPALGAALLLLPASCDLPRDPGGTLEEVRGGTLSVAVVAPGLSPPEEEALALLARDLDARLDLAPMDLHRAVAQLRASEPDGVAVHLVVGAIPEGTPFADEVAATRPLGRERFVLLLPPGENGFLLAANRAVGAEEERRLGAGP